MADNEELRAMGLEELRVKGLEESNTKFCRRCKNKITEDEDKKFNSYCSKCYEEQIQEQQKRNIENATLKKEKEIKKTIKYVYSHKSNLMATILSIVGTLEILGSFILGIVLGETYQIGVYYKEFNNILCISTIVIGIVVGIFILGFAEIIQKLQNIEDNTRN